MRPIAMAAAALVCGLAGAPAPADELDGKSLPQLLDLLRDRIAGREEDIRTLAACRDFDAKERTRLFGKLRSGLTHLEKRWSDEWTRNYVQGCLHRAYGDYENARKKFDWAIKKARQPFERPSVHLDLARLYQLLEKPNDAIQEVKKAQGKGGDMGMLQREFDRIQEMAGKMREYHDIVGRRDRAPRDAPAQWAVCMHLLGFRGPGGPQQMLERRYRGLDCLVQLGWMKKQFAEHQLVVSGLVDQRLYEIAAELYDFDGALEAAETLHAQAGGNPFVKEGRLDFEVARLIRDDDARRSAALRTLRYLQQTYPGHPAVKSGEIEKQIGDLESQPGVKPSPPGKPVPYPPWR